MKVALIQQSCTPSKEENLQKLAQNIAEVAQKGAELVVLQELHNTPYFCQVEDTRNFDLAETIPGSSTDFSVPLRKSTVSFWLPHSLRSVPLVFITTLPSYLRKMVQLPEYTAKCTFLMIPLITRNSTSHRVIWVFNLLILQWGVSVCKYAGINGIRKALVSWRLPVRSY